MRELFMSATDPKTSNRKFLVMLGILGAGTTGIIGGAVGGAAGAYYVLETMAKPKFSPKIKNAVIEYDMPAQGARPIDIVGIKKAGTPLHPCLIGFLENQRDMMPHAKWKEVRIYPYFKVEGDIITEMAFAQRNIAITRGNEITVRVAEAFEYRENTKEALMFHELFHVDQYASGRMDLPDYAASAARAYASGMEMNKNDYEQEARRATRELISRWIESEEREKCHPDVRKDGQIIKGRSPSESPMVKYAIFDHGSQQYNVVEFQFTNTMSGKTSKKQ